MTKAEFLRLKKGDMIGDKKIIQVDKEARAIGDKITMTNWQIMLEDGSTLRIDDPWLGLVGEMK